jgi:hypothetical protein
MSNERVKIALYSLQLSETDLGFLADLILELEQIGYILSVEAEFASSLAPHRWGRYHASCRYLYRRL